MGGGFHHPGNGLGGIRVADRPFARPSASGRRVSQQGVEEIAEVVTVAGRVDQQHGAAGPLQHPSIGRLMVTGSPGSGTSTAGTPATDSSATVMAPARHTTRSAAV